MNSAELILNPDSSIYHLHLVPTDLASTIILVGDPDRVSLVSQFFDSIELKKQKREFCTHTGYIGTKRITVISTGIGTDNIDIVLNELDALVNIDFSNRIPKDKLTPLQLIRIGTSGSIHPDVGVDEILISAMAVGTDSLGSYYQSEKVNHPALPEWAYVTARFAFDMSNFSLPFHEGITLTCPGFYGPQGRVLRIKPGYTIPINDLHKEILHDFSFTNLEMETAGIYLLAKQLGHKAISFNAILANRQAGQFSEDPAKIIEDLTKAVLHWITLLR